MITGIERFRRRAVWKYLSTFNLFLTESSTVLTRQRERISTYLYLILLITCITLVIFYAGFSEQTKTDTISVPSLSRYEHLQSIHSDTLQCPCSNTSLSYTNFILHLNATFHPFCSSEFVSSKWLDYFNANIQYRVWWLQKEDFRFWGVLYFKFLRTFCFLSTSTISDTITNFQSNLLISSEIMPLAVFETQIDETLAVFQKSTSTLFIRPLEVFRASIQGNALISLLGSNWELYVINMIASAPLLNIPMTYRNGTCSCGVSNSCLEPATFVNLTHDKVYIVDGVFSGCSSLESILSSSLSCFFSNSCIVNMMEAMHLGEPDSFPREILDIAPLQFSSSNAHFKVNDTIETIVHRLFIDSWSNETSYQRYYDACAPTQCTYSYGKRFDVVYILTVFLSIFNAFSMGLYFVTPHMVNLGYVLRDKIRI